MISNRLATAAGPEPTAVLLEAEDAVNNLGIGSGAGASGRGALGYWLSPGGFVRFAVSAPQTATYRISLRHASAWDAPSTRTVTVDGRDTGVVTFPSTGDWRNWAVTILSLPLTAGTHTFELSYRSSDQGAVDLDNITVSLESTDPVPPVPGAGGGTLAATTSPTTASPTTASPTTASPTAASPPSTRTTPTTVPAPLEWSPGLSSATVPTGATSMLFEAEDAANNLVLETAWNGTGRGSLGYWSADGFVQFTMNAPVYGTYRFRVRHSSAWDAPATRSLLVDGIATGQVSFPSTGAWGSWQTTDVALTLAAGTHTLKLLYAPGDWGALNVDNAAVDLVTSLPNPPGSTTTVPVRAFSMLLEAERATHNVVVETDQAGTGGASLGYWTVPGGFARFTVTVPTPSVYRLSARHASAWDADATRTLLIDGTPTTRVVFPSSGAWDQWRTADTSVPLTAGTHTVEFRFASSDTGALNLDNLDITSLAATSPPVAPPPTTSTATTGVPTTSAAPTTSPAPTTAAPKTTSKGNRGSTTVVTTTSAAPTTAVPTTAVSTTTAAPTTAAPTTAAPTTSPASTTAVPTTGPAPTVPSTGPSVPMEAEDATNNLVLETIWGGTGRGSLGYWSDGGFVRFNVNAPLSGSYRFRVKHASAWDAPTSRSILVDGNRTGQVSFPSTGAWGSWRTTDVSIPLTAGSHTLQLLYAPGDWGALNIDSASFDLVAAGAVPPPTTSPTTTSAPTTTISAPALSTGVVAGDPRMCAGPGSRAAVTTILNNQRDSLRGQAGGGVWSMEGMYSLLLNPLEMAIHCNDRPMLDTMSYIVLGSSATMSTTSEGRVWLDNGAEVRLISAEWIHVLSRVIDGISAVPPSQRTANMNAVTQTFVPVVAAHVNRWVFATPFWGMSGCPGLSATGHSGYVSLLATKTIGGVKSYCNGLIDTDLWIMVASSELLRAAANDSSLVPLGSLGISQQALAAYVRGSGDLLRARFIPTSLTKPNGAGAQGLDLDPGIFSDLYSESGYSAYTGRTFPTAANAGSSPKAGWDTSHMRPIALTVNSLYRSRSVSGGSFPTDGEITALSNQVAYGMLVDGNMQWPQFSNYFSGLNGWYRVNYNGRLGFGYGPSDLGNTGFMEGALGLWAAWNPDLAAINARLGVILQATDAATVNWRTATYAKSWWDYQWSGTPNLYPSTSTFLLQHIAASVGASW